MRSLAILGLLFGRSAAQQTGNHPGWERWCGKVYQPEYPSFDPGGQTVEPTELQDGPALYIQFKPHYSIYLESEDEAEFVVNAEVSKWYGQPWPDLISPEDAPPVSFTISLVSNNHVLVSGSITVGSEAEVYSFNLAGLEPRFTAYEVVLSATSELGESTVSAKSEFFFLPEKDTGSVAKLDNLNGGFLLRNAGTKGKFEPLLPYGFYASCDGFLCEDDSIGSIKAYHDLGLNSMVPLTTIWDSRPAFEYMNELDLKFMYDLRGYYKNLTAVREHVSAIKDFDTIYAYWGFDEPDGWQDPFNGTVISSNLIRTIDPYHPVAVTLNCQNYYFKEYTAGADLIMEDAYPIGINSTFSKWGTACNTTYGDCGCDNCQGNVQDVSSRLDDLAQYEEWLGLWPKTKAHNPQSFHGEGYWSRDPTADEEVAMNALAFNHGVKAIVSWVWPTSDDLAKIHGEFATVVANSPVRDFVVQKAAERVEVPDLEILDVAYWVLGDEMLLSVINGGYEPINKTVVIPLPKTMAATGLKTVVWGDASWSISGDVSVNALEGMSTQMAVFKL